MKPRGRPRDLLQPPSKEALRQARKRILDKYANDDDTTSVADRWELVEIWLWSHHRREMEKIHAKLIKAAIAEIANEIAQRFYAIQKLQHALTEYMSVTNSPPK